MCETLGIENGFFFPSIYEFCVDTAAGIANGRVFRKNLINLSKFLFRKIGFAYRKLNFTEARAKRDKKSEKLIKIFVRSECSKQNPELICNLKILCWALH